MKKVSTGVTKQIRNFSQAKLTIGLDLGDRSSWYCLLDESGAVLVEEKVSTTPKAMREAFEGPPHCRIALETGMHSPWVSRVLSELGHEVIGVSVIPCAIEDCKKLERTSSLGGKQDFYLLPQRRIGNAGAVEKGRALFGREFQRLFKKIANLLPALRRHVSSAFIC
jgi:hypothetical protein